MLEGDAYVVDLDVGEAAQGLRQFWFVTRSERLPLPCRLTRKGHTCAGSSCTQILDLAE